MLKRFASLVLIGLMVVLPVQGTAAALAEMICNTEDHHPAQVSSEAHDDHGTPHQHASDDSTPGQPHTGHFCCDHTATGIAPSLAPAAAADFPVYQSSLTPLVSLFVPEQPQRPPRA